MAIFARPEVAILSGVHCNMKRKISVSGNLHLHCELRHKREGGEFPPSYPTGRMTNSHYIQTYVVNVTNVGVHFCLLLYRVKKDT